MTLPAPAEQGHYSKAPILEALLEIFVTPLPPEKLATLDALGAEIRSDYPQKSPRMQFTAEITTGPQAGTTTSHRNDGFIYSSVDGKQRLQIHLSGFAFHRLTPYENWQLFRDEARRLWDLCSAAFEGAAVVRVGVRYINQLSLPFGRDIGE
ncbi:MAG: TIGR04255 family protein, partial [Candidatus Eremiobacteraeota bacterium]|nr:TIGR04255 family protein [Candidatus Eremiobacteraeota bacterium]